VIGQVLGPYRVRDKLGQGGMGEVYRAHDSKLGRDVALKILPATFAADPERLARFQREARVLAALNHPHIAAIYGLEEAGEVSGLVLELVEGRTLAETLAAGRLPLSDALAIARQITEALEAAHARGIVHRDLKPSNIMLTPRGDVKVLDFGLATALEADAAHPGVSQSPTFTAAGTRAGVILGTAAYMSPEQARGHPVDKRADLWAFGCVLFEMLTGRRAFARGTLSDTIAAVIERDPDWSALPATTPEPVRRLLRRCLQKSAGRRLHDIVDARLELEDAAAAPDAVDGWARRGSAWIWLAGSAVLLALALAVSAAWMLSRPGPRGDHRIDRLTDLAGLEETPALSPDGRSVAFTAAVGGTRHVFVKLLAGGAPLQITRDPADHQHPRWSRDSSSVLYFSPAATGDAQGAIWQVSALGGVPRRLTGSIGAADVGGDGRLTFFRLSGARIELVTATADGSPASAIADFDPSRYYLYPRWSPDGRWIAFQRGDSIRFDIFVVPSGGGEPRQLTHENTMMSGFAWMPDSRSILVSSSRRHPMPYLPTSGLWQVALRDGGVTQVIAGEVSYLHPDVSSSGAIVASRLRLQSDIWRVPADGAPLENVQRAVRVTRQTGHVLTPTAGPGDREVAFLSDSGGHANVWVIDTKSGELRQVTHERDPDVATGVPVWSPDGRTIAFVSSRGNRGLAFGVWLVSPDGSNLRVAANPGLGPAWSHDGRWLYFSTRSGTDVADVVLQKMPVDGGASMTVTTERLRNVIGSDGSTLYYTFERPLVDGTPEFEIRAATPESAPFRVLARIPSARVPLWQIVNPALSPDGRQLAQALTDGFSTNIWSLSTATGEWRQITDFGDRPTFIARRVSWSSDGRAVFAAVAEGDADIVRLEGLLDVPRE
jgi:Tol biopolymer transport system component